VMRLMGQEKLQQGKHKEFDRLAFQVSF